MNRPEIRRPIEQNAPYNPTVEENLISFAKASELDILGFDSHIQTLITYNQHQDLDGLICLLGELVSKLGDLEMGQSLTPVEATASLRDLGFVASSIRKIEKSPINFVPNLEQLLINLGKTANAIPRDNVYTYSLWNPRDSRQRSFTGTREEHVFIESIRTWIEQLEECRKILSTFTIDLWQSTLIEEKAESLLTHFEKMVEQMVNVRKHIPTSFFYSQLQPYFHAFEVGGIQYEAPSGAHMNFLVIDSLLWGRDSQDFTYLEYLRHNEIYLPFMYRKFLKETANNGSVIGNLQKGIIEGKINANDRSVQIALSSILTMLNKIISMRRVHFALAREQESIKVEEGKEATLTGNDILSALLRQTAQSRDIIKSYATRAI